MRAFYFKLAKSIESNRWVLLFAIASAAFLSLFYGVHNIHLSEDIVDFIPQEDPDLVESYLQLQAAPFSKKVLVTLEAEEGIQVDLNSICSDLINLLQAPYFISQFKEIDGESAQQVFNIVFEHIHLLLNEEELSEIVERIQNPQVFAHIHQQNLNELMSPEGMFAKDAILNDPLRLRDCTSQKLKSLSSKRFDIGSSGALISADGNRALLALDSDISLTDTQEIERMIDHFQTAWNSIRPDGVTADWLSPHRYSYANANSIKHDINRVLLISLFLIGAVFFYYFRNWSSLLLFIGPAFVFAFAFGSLALTFDHVSSISVGFASILLGISIDYSLHIFIHVRSGKGEKYAGIAELLKPISISFLTTVSAFAVLLLSSVKTHREFAVFSIAGLLAAFIFAVVALPSFIFPKPDAKLRHLMVKSTSPGQSNKRIIAAWGCGLFILALGLPRIQLSQDNSDLYIVTKELRVLENSMDEDWGEGFRRTTLCVVESPTLQGALEMNDVLFQTLSGGTHPTDFISIHNILPSIRTQQKNYERWKEVLTAELVRQLGQRLKEVRWPITGFRKIEQSITSISDPITPESYENTFVSDILANFWTQSPEGVKIYSMVGMHSDTPPLKIPSSVGKELSAASISKRMNVITVKQFRNLVMTTLIAVIAAAFLLFRNWRLFICAMLPMFSGLLAVAGFVGWSHTPLTFFHAAAALLIIGLGIDYGILITEMAKSDSLILTTYSIWISSLTTIAGFIGLTFASHPFLRTLGTDVSIGIATATVTALWVCPRMLQLITPSKP